MEFQLLPKQAIELDELAERTGQTVDDLVREAVGRMLLRHEDFKGEVEVGIAEIGQGEFIEEQEMDARVERMLRA